MCPYMYNLNRTGHQSGFHPTHSFTAWCLGSSLVLTLANFFYGQIAIYPGLPGGSSVFSPLTCIIANIISFHCHKGPDFRDIVCTHVSQKKILIPLKLIINLSIMSVPVFSRRKLQFISSEKGVYLSDSEILCLAAPSLGLCSL